MFASKSPKIALFLDRVLKTCAQFARPSDCYPVDRTQQDSIFSWSQSQLQQSRYQMRINHTGEICAQALYAGHSHSGQCLSLNQWLVQAQREEYAHLQWCQQRLYELGSQPSQLDPLFYIGSYGLAKTLSSLSHSYNLRFIRETEKQVQDHLKAQLPLLTHDAYSSQIIQQMIMEEKEHHDQAYSRESAPMPQIFQSIMRGISLVMKVLVSYV